MYRYQSAALNVITSSIVQKNPIEALFKMTWQLPKKIKSEIFQRRCSANCLFLLSLTSGEGAVFDERRKNDLLREIQVTSVKHTHFAYEVTLILKLFRYYVL